MTPEETKLLAGHMGHDLNIHLDHYAVQLSILERTKVARILSAVQNGAVTRLESPTDINRLTIEDKDLITKQGNWRNLCFQTS